MANDFKSEEQMKTDLEAAKKLAVVGGQYAHYKHPTEKRYEVVGVAIMESNEGVCVV